MRLVIALGGNALLRRGQRPDAALQLDNIQTAAKAPAGLAQCLRNAGVTKPVVGLVTQTVVDPDDRSFSTPSTFIGPVYDEPTGRRLSREHGWPVQADGPYWRRVVALPEPIDIVELGTVLLLAAGQTVVVAMTWTPRSPSWIPQPDTLTTKAA